MPKASEKLRKSLSKKWEEGCFQKGKMVEELQISRMALDTYLNGKSTPSLDVAEKIANYFGMSLGEFIGDTPNEHTATDCMRIALKNMSHQITSLDKKKI